MIVKFLSEMSQEIKFHKEGENNLKFILRPSGYNAN
jgi:hypothetical protein